MALITDLLDAHERAQAANGPDRADGGLVVSEDKLLIIFHHCVSVFAPLLSGCNATDLFLDHHVQELLLLLSLIQLLLRVALQRDLTNLRQVVRLRALRRRMVRLQASKWSSAARAGTMPTTAVDSLPALLLGQHAGTRRVADNGTALIHLGAQMLVGAVQAAAVQALVRVLARVRLLLCLIQDVFRALSFDYLALHFLNVEEPQIHRLLHHWIVVAQAQILHLRTLLVKAVRGAGSGQLTVRVDVDEAHGVLAHAWTIVLSHLLIDHQIVFQSLFPIYFVLFYHRVGIHLVDAGAVQHVGVRLIGRVLLAQHLPLAYVGHRVAAAEADLDGGVRVDAVHVASMVAG